VAHTGEVRVKDYVKPLFFLKVETEQETLRAGGTLDAAISAERYAGGVPREVRLSAQLFRVRAEAPAWVDDAGLGETGSVTTYGGDRGRSAAIVPSWRRRRPRARRRRPRGSRCGSLAVLLGPRNADYASLRATRTRPGVPLEVVLDRRATSCTGTRGGRLVFAGEPATLAVRAVTAAGNRILALWAA
jgi:hypothetical protein